MFVVNSYKIVQKASLTNVRLTLKRRAVRQCTGAHVTWARWYADVPVSIFQGPHTPNDHQLRFQCTSDPIEIEVDHFWQDVDPVHTQIYLQFQELYTIIVAGMGVCK